MCVPHAHAQSGPTPDARGRGTEPDSGARKPHDLGSVFDIYRYIPVFAPFLIILAVVSHWAPQAVGWGQVKKV
jgi:hypothetical protein